MSCFPSPHSPFINCFSLSLSVLFYPHSLMPSTTASYGYGSYGSIAVPAASSSDAVISYARPYYASTEKRSVEGESKNEKQCGPSPRSCPVCEDYVNLDVIGRFCSLDGVYTVKSEESNEKSCAKAKINQVLMGEKRAGKNIRLSIRDGCSCPQLNSADEVIVFTSRSKNIVNNNLVADSEVYIVPKTDSNVADVQDLKERCSQY